MKVGQIQYKYESNDNAILRQMKRLISGSIFYNYTPIIKLQITAPEGTEFRINKSEDPIYIGPNCHYNLDLSNIGGEIYFLTFAPDSLNYEGAYVIIDFIYKD